MRQATRVRLAACGGGGGPDESLAEVGGAAGSASSAAGLWVGSGDAALPAAVVVLDDGGSFALYSNSAPGGADVASLVSGTVRLAGTQLTSTTAFDLDIEASSVHLARLTASVAPGATLEGATVSEGPYGRLGFAASYGGAPAGASPPALDGTYRGASVLREGIVESGGIRVQGAIDRDATVSIQPGGALTASAGGCNASGTVTWNATRRVHEVRVTFGPPPCYFDAEAFTGVAYLDVSASRLYVAVRNGNRRGAVVFTGRRGA